MAQVRNVSSSKLLLGDTPVGVDELHDVDDAAFLDRAWPKSTWQLVTPPASGLEQVVADAVLWTSTQPQTSTGEVAAPEPLAGPPAPVGPPVNDSSSTDNAGDGTSSESE